MDLFYTIWLPTKQRLVSHFKDQAKTENKALTISNEVGDWTWDSQPENDVGAYIYIF